MNALRRLWATLRRPSSYSLLTLLVVGAIGGILFWGGFHTALEATNTMDFCTSCHEHDIVTAEYNRSIPGVLKNAIDHASRPYGQSAFTGKPAGILGISIGAAGTSMAQQHLRNVLAYLDVPTMGQPEAFLQAKEGFFDTNGDIGPASRNFLQDWMRRYADWVARHPESERAADIDA